MLKKSLIHGALLALVGWVWLLAGMAAAGPSGQGQQDFSGNPPRRIISLAPNLTEILYFLELGDRVVGVTSFCNYPPEVKSKPRIGTYWEFNLEAILALKPDMAMVMQDQGEGERPLTILRHWGIPVFVGRAETLDELFRLIEEVARLTGQDGVAARKLPALKARVRAVEARIKGRPRPRVFLEIDQEPMITVGGRGIHHDLIQRAGGVNIAQNINQRYPIFSLEDVIQARPEVILFTGMLGEDSLNARLHLWQKWPWLPAVQNHRLHWVHPDLIDRPSPRLVDGLETLARLFHPEL